MQRSIAIIIRTLLPVAALCLTACTSDDSERALPSQGRAPATNSSATANAPALGEANRATQRALGASRFELGQHYLRLTPIQPTDSGPDRIEIVEFFSYRSSPSFDFEVYLESWEDQKAEYVVFNRIPSVSDSLDRLHARAFYAAETLNPSREIHGEFFREIHLNGNALDSLESLAEFFSRFDIDAAEFAGAFESFAVHAMLEQADEFSRRYKITSVPAVVINGKYATTATMVDSYESLVELMNHLAEREVLKD